jgi:flagellar biosynthesis protein FlhF
MELKRILARDARSAHDKAIALYGRDALVISSTQVNGQTELIVAADIAPSTSDILGSPKAQDIRLHSSDSASAQQAAPMAFKTFEDAMQDTLNGRTEPEMGVEPISSTELSPQEQQLRGKEIVDMVRQEIQMLRQEFQRTQQLQAWQTQLGLPPGMQALAQAMQDTGVPARLRALLADALRMCDNPTEGLGLIRDTLINNLPAAQTGPDWRGVHALCGPSGVGKSLMCARLARQTAQTLHSERVALISFNDTRAGAWSQLQLLATQAGVDAYRAKDMATLELLLEELKDHDSVIIDTPGLDFTTHAHALAHELSDIHVHAVLHADASASLLQRLDKVPTSTWSSLILTKLDESSQAWPLLQRLTDPHPLPISWVGHGDKLSSKANAFDPAELVELALMPLQETLAPATTPDALFALNKANHKVWYG